MNLDVLVMMTMTLFIDAEDVMGGINDDGDATV